MGACCTSRDKQDFMMETVDLICGGGATTHIVENSPASSGSVSEVCPAEDCAAKKKVSFDESAAIWPNELLSGLPCRRPRFAVALDEVVVYTIEEEFSDDGGSTNSAGDLVDMESVFASSSSDDGGLTESMSDDEECIISAPVPGEADAFLEVVARVWELELQEKQIFKEWDKRAEMKQQLVAGGCVATVMPKANIAQVAIGVVPPPLVPATSLTNAPSVPAELSHVRRFSHSRGRSVAQPVPV